MGVTKTRLVVAKWLHPTKPSGYGRPILGCGAGERTRWREPSTVASILVAALPHGRNTRSLRCWLRSPDRFLREALPPAPAMRRRAADAVDREDRIEEQHALRGPVAQVARLQVALQRLMELPADVVKAPREIPVRRDRKSQPCGVISAIWILTDDNDSDLLERRQSKSLENEVLAGVHLPALYALALQECAETLHVILFELCAENGPRPVWEDLRERRAVHAPGRLPRPQAISRRTAASRIAPTESQTPRGRVLLRLMAIRRELVDEAGSEAVASERAGWMNRSDSWLEALAATLVEMWHERGVVSQGLCAAISASREPRQLVAAPESAVAIWRFATLALRPTGRTRQRRSRDTTPSNVPSFARPHKRPVGTVWVRHGRENGAISSVWLDLGLVDARRLWSSFRGWRLRGRRGGGQLPEDLGLLRAP